MDNYIPRQEREMGVFMQYGYIKCAAAVPDVRVADCAHNAEDIISLMKAAAENDVRVLVFPELCITSAGCGDLFTRDVLLDGALKALEKIADASKEMDMIAVVGCPLFIDGRLYDCAVWVGRGGILAVVPKQHLTASQKRVFTPACNTVEEIELLGDIVPFGRNVLLRCEQLPELCIGCELGEDMVAVHTPGIDHALAGATIIAAPSAVPVLVGREDAVRTLISADSARMKCGIILASAGEGESTQDTVCGGHCVIAEDGSILAESSLFSSGLTIMEIDVKAMMFARRRDGGFVSTAEHYEVFFSLELTDTSLLREVAENPFLPLDDNSARCRDILAMQAHALARRVSHVHADKLVLGISGGLDSTLALLVCVETMKLLGRPMSDIVTVTMPCFGTTERTRSNAEDLCVQLGTDFRAVDIMASVKQHFADIGHDESVHNVVYENSQARERTQILMDLANAVNGLVVGTGDLSELALGWATYNGDHMSMYGVNGGVPKTVVRAVVSWYAGQADKALRDTLISVVDTPVSPELLPADDNGDIAQKTEDLVGPYELHDFFIYYFLRCGFGPKKIYRLAKHVFDGRFSDEVILKWLRTFFRRFFNQQFKRSCLPDGVKIGTVGLSPRGDWSMPSDGSSTLWMSELDEIN